MTPPKVVAEIGCNHRGEVETAEEMIKIAAIFCHVDYVKFQKRCNKELLSPEQYNSPHPNPINSYGRTYGEHRENLEFDADTHRHLKRVCESFGIGYSTSVWELTSAKEMAALEPDMLKIPSASNTHTDMLQWLADHYGGQVHISLGMTTRAEEESVVDLFRRAGRLKDVVLYACTSGYPVPFEDIHLNEITRLRRQYEQDVAAIGFSGHHLGIAVDVAAMTLGARWIERHYTLDRTWKGTDHSASLEPDGLRRIVRDVRHVSMALTDKPAEVLPIEEPQREKLKWKAAG